MSLLGIDVGSSSIKAAAYREDGVLYKDVRKDLTPQYPQPGWWEQDPNEVWETTCLLLHRLAQEEFLRKDPPKAVAVSASVRENFPADELGFPLANCIMAADVRGAEYEVYPDGVPLPEPWSFSCGHMRERMDPFNRLQWWLKNRSEIMNKARFFPGWPELLTLKMCGRAVTDGTTAARWMIYDLHTQSWDLNRLSEFGISSEILPEVLPWGTIIGDVKKDILEDWGFHHPIKLAVGASDLNCAGLGAGVSAIGDVCLVAGSFENLLIATDEFPTARMLLRGLSITPHPGDAGRCVWAICPTGTAVLNWARNITNMSIDELDHKLNEAGSSPSPVLAAPYLSGAFIYWEGGRKLRGALFGLTLATSQIDIVRGFMDSISYDHVNTLSLLREQGVKIETVKAMGGGSRSAWWTQLKCDMMGVPIEVISQPEPGTLGAALLAGVAIGTYNNITEASKKFAGELPHNKSNFRK